MNAEHQNRPRWKRAARRLRRAALGRPTFRPGWRAAAAIMLLAGLALAPLLGLQRPAPNLETAERDPAAVFTEDASQYLTNSQVEMAVIDYLAVTAWAETVRQAAEREDPDFSLAMLAAPSKRCAAGYRVARLQPGGGGSPEESSRTLIECVRQERELSRPRAKRWNEMTAVEREAHARARLRLMWKAISPEYQMSARAALQYANNLNRENNEEFRKFAEEYGECEQYVEDRAPELAEAGDGAALGKAWSDISTALRHCASSRTERLFQGGKNTGQ